MLFGLSILFLSISFVHPNNDNRTQKDVILRNLTSSADLIKEENGINFAELKFELENFKQALDARLNSTRNTFESDWNSTRMAMNSFLASTEKSLYDQLNTTRKQLMEKIENLERSAEKYNGTESWNNTDPETIQVATATFKPRNCKEIYQKNSNSINGFYIIYPYDWAPTKPVQVKCDMGNGGGWTLIQKRDNVVNYRISFNRSLAEYEEGFRNRDNEEFWIGLKTIHALTSQSTTQLRIDLWDFENSHRYAMYQYFHVRHARDNYRLEVLQYSGNALDGMAEHHNMSFTTYDRDLDTWSSNCAEEYKGGWWYKNCIGSNLNGVYMGGKVHTGVCVNWQHWRGDSYSLKKVELKVRPAF